MLVSIATNFDVMDTEEAAYTIADVLSNNGYQAYIDGDIMVINGSELSVDIDSTGVCICSRTDVGEKLLKQIAETEGLLTLFADSLNGCESANQEC